MKWTLGLVCLFLISFVKTLEFDDASCIKQLNYFDDELSKRENWAIKCEKKPIDKVIEKLNYFLCSFRHLG